MLCWRTKRGGSPKKQSQAHELQKSTATSASTDRLRGRLLRYFEDLQLQTRKVINLQ